ncbi:glucosamine-6-phosphate isomerase [Colletotrichum higginsianum]|uniref:Glucosamine-6-phosphate isomerase n=2 Tax=Colletotrichum higginsianum TaxID=80884 RepID=H1VQ00_COLHI|nr:Glucosamine-6-phosphate isomerase [Colletotrichum higginsianum IMI 349063]OBR11446.1 Glucosamine-6-phosphate isomerase [Colletotrichum higginsianum IMI 349063]TIC99657.1 Glucosamine-6-phosphate deaminase [Colletotrichum higginsianum]GJC93098.1 glucosamine-6-phosphate isomerase [Colletotrichum higginsianum]CCF42306.1 glucosamine-6-phosphate isomerase [Colletotrichum higginsianum]
MRLIIRPDSRSASAHVAHYILDRIRTFQPTPEKPFVLGLPTGSSPIQIYEILVAEYKAGRISFENVITFNMDEYVGLPQTHPESYHSFMFRHFFSHVDIKPENVHILNGNASDLDAECAAYEDRIRAVGGIDLFLGGVGPDGHIAFNEPGSSLASRTRVKTLAMDTIRANARFFGGDLKKVPQMALTVGVQTVMEAREVVIIVNGANKSIALQKAIEGGVNHMWTLSCLQLHPYSMIVADEDATLELQVKTVKYFKSIEKVGLGKGFEQKLPLRLRTVSLVSPPQTPADSKAAFDEDHLVELTPDSMSSRIATWPVI